MLGAVSSAYCVCVRACVHPPRQISRPSPRSLALLDPRASPVATVDASPPSNRHIQEQGYIPLGQGERIVDRRDCGVAVVVVMMMTVVVVVVMVCPLYTLIGRQGLLLFSLPPLLLVTADSPACRCFCRAGCDEHIQRTRAMSTYLGLGEGLRWLLVPDNTSLLRAFRFHRALFPAHPVSPFLSLFFSLPYVFCLRSPLPFDSPGALSLTVYVLSLTNVRKIFRERLKDVQYSVDVI